MVIQVRETERGMYVLRFTYNAKRITDVTQVVCKRYVYVGRSEQKPVLAVGR